MYGLKALQYTKLAFIKCILIFSVKNEKMFVYKWYQTKLSYETNIQIYC
jgi:hypothetical protein